MADEDLATGAHKSRRGWVVAIPLVIAFAVGGVACWGTRGAPAEVGAGEERRVKSTLHLETFVLNLSDPDQRSYLRVGIDLGLGTDLKKTGEGPPVALVRDTILGVLAQGKVDDLLTAKGKQQLKEDLLRALQQRVPELGVEEVYFTEFLIQR